MRVIKFRGRTKEGIWVYGHLTEFHYPDNIKPRVCFIWEQSEDRYRIEKTQVDANTIGQFTGLHDSRGNEIYEGDLVNCRVPLESKPFHTCSVEFFADGWNFINDDFNICDSPDMIEILEIIGNVHETSNLLNSK